MKKEYFVSKTGRFAPTNVINLKKNEDYSLMKVLCYFSQYWVIASNGSSVG